MTYFSLTSILAIFLYFITKQEWKGYSSASIYFLNAFLAILHTSMSFLFVHCRNVLL